MRYDYTCLKCNITWELSCSIDERDKACKEPCPQCNSIGNVTREVSALAITHDGIKTLQQRAGRHFNDVLERVKKSHPTKLRDGTKQTINTL